MNGLRLECHLATVEAASTVIYAAPSIKLKGTHDDVPDTSAHCITLASSDISLVCDVLVYCLGRSFAQSASTNSGNTVSSWVCTDNSHHPQQSYISVNDGCHLQPRDCLMMITQMMV